MIPTPSIAPPPAQFDLECQTLILGAGACGLVAALSAHEAGQNVLVVEADTVPRGSTALSAGLIPAPGTRAQKDAGIDDSPSLFAADIQAKAHNENDPAIVDMLANTIGNTIDWLSDQHGLPFSVVTDFDYPGHSRRRMHGLPTRSGAELIDALRTKVEAQDVDIVCERRGNVLHFDGTKVSGITVELPDGTTERIGCERLILACNGYGGNRTLVTEHMPEIEDALWFGHDGNKGEAVLWGQAIGAELRHMGAYQGHGNVASPHGILISWAVMTEGGVQVNRDGQRFWDETRGYSEAARAVMGQPDGVAFAIFDARIAAVARQFEDFKNAEVQGAIRVAESVGALAEALGLPADALNQTLADLPIDGRDAFGRTFTGPPLSAPYHGVKVTGALFHTQGGLRTDTAARVLRPDGSFIAGLYAAGGAACGVSGKADDGYLSGNGLLSAVAMGRVAGLGG